MQVNWLEWGTTGGASQYHNECYVVKHVGEEDQVLGGDQRQKIDQECLGPEFDNIQNHGEPQGTLPGKWVYSEELWHSGT